MKRILLPFLLLSIKLSIAQINYYTFNSDSLYDEESVKTRYYEALKNLPPKYSLTPLIFHKVIKSDSIINYLSFAARKNESVITNNEFEFQFEQDSLFFFLNKKLPEFKQKDLKGNTFSSSQLTGKPTLINYWAIYCKPCIEEIPQLNKLKEKYGEEMNFIALTENTCAGDNLIDFLEKHPFNYYILQNAEAYKKALKIAAIPINLFVDKEGYIRYIQKNYPIERYDKETNKYIYSKNNFFIKIIDELVKQ